VSSITKLSPSLDTVTTDDAHVHPQFIFLKYKFQSPIPFPPSQSITINNQSQSITINHNQQSITINNQSQSTINHNQQSITINNQSQSTITTNNQSQPTINHNQQSITTNNQHSQSTNVPIQPNFHHHFCSIFEIISSTISSHPTSISLTIHSHLLISHHILSHNTNNKQPTHLSHLQCKLSTIHVVGWCRWWSWHSISHQ
jgi:hypothetical protein